MKIIWVVAIGIACYALGCVTGTLASRDGEKQVIAQIDEKLNKAYELEKASQK